MLGLVQNSFLILLHDNSVVLICDVIAGTCAVVFNFPLVMFYSPAAIITYVAKKLDPGVAWYTPSGVRTIVDFDSVCHAFGRVNVTTVVDFYSVIASLPSKSISM